MIEKIRKNLIIYLSKSRCPKCFNGFERECFWHYYNDQYMLYFFSNKRFFNLNTKPNLMRPITFKGKEFVENISYRKTVSPIKFRTFGKIVLINISCANCNFDKMLEFNLKSILNEKFRNF